MQPPFKFHSANTSNQSLNSASKGFNKTHISWMSPKLY